MTVLGIREAYRAAVHNGTSEAAARPVEQVPHAADPALSAVLEELLAESPFVHLCLVDRAGKLTAEATRPLHATGDLARLRTVLHALARTYPRAGLGRVFVQDDSGTVVLVTLPQERYLIAVAEKSTQPGQVSISMGRVAARLAQPPAPLQNSAARS